MDLQTKIKTVHIVDDADLSEFIKTYLPQYLEGKAQMCGEVADYNVVAYEEWNNDESHEYEVRCTSEEFEKYTDTLMYSLPSVLDFLCSKGHMDPGSYVISVCW